MKVADTEKVCRICGTRQAIEWEEQWKLVTSDPVGAPHDTCLICFEREFTTVKPHIRTVGGKVVEMPRPWFTTYPFIYPHRLPRDAYYRYLKDRGVQKRLI